MVNLLVHWPYRQFFSLSRFRSGLEAQLAAVIAQELVNFKSKAATGTLRRHRPHLCAVVATTIGGSSMASQYGKAMFKTRPSQQ